MSPRVRSALLTGLVAIAVGCLGLVIGMATSAPAACRDAVLAVDSVFEVIPDLPVGPEGERARQLTVKRAQEYSALRAECLGQSGRSTN